MPSGVEHPPGLEPEVPRPKRPRAASVGATPAASSAPISTAGSSSPTPTSTPAVSGPGVAEVSRRSPGPEGGDSQPRSPQGGPGSARVSERAS
eukprot:10924053-Alexandrium_andersonii.AAC.1